MLDGRLALPEGKHLTTWPWAQSQSQWPIGRQPQPRGGHSCWLPGPENRSFSGSTQGWHLLNLQVKVKFIASVRSSQTTHLKWPKDQKLNPGGRAQNWEEAEALTIW